MPVSGKRDIIAGKEATYTIGQMAKKLGVSTSTLRYYDREGLLPFVGRTSGGARVFRDEDMPMINIIGCLKAGGRSMRCPMTS